MSAGVRDPLERRLTGWAVFGASERALDRAVAVAVAVLEVGAGFMTDWIVERLDVNRIVERLRLDDIIAKLELTDVILLSSGGVTAHVLDNARARAAGADAGVERAMARVRLRRAEPSRSPAGFASRAAAMVVDVVVIAATFYGGLALAALTVQVLRFHHLDATAVSAPVASTTLAGWTALYFWVGWCTVGKAVGKGIVGLPSSGTTAPR